MNSRCIIEYVFSWPTLKLAWSNPRKCLVELFFTLEGVIQSSKSRRPQDGQENYDYRRKADKILRSCMFFIFKIDLLFMMSEGCKNGEIQYVIVKKDVISGHNDWVDLLWYHLQRIPISLASVEGSDETSLPVLGTVNRRIKFIP